MNLHSSHKIPTVYIWKPLRNIYFLVLDKSTGRRTKWFVDQQKLAFTIKVWCVPDHSRQIHGLSELYSRCLMFNRRTFEFLSCFATTNSQFQLSIIFFCKFFKMKHIFLFIFLIHFNSNFKTYDKDWYNPLTIFFVSKFQIL